MSFKWCIDLFLLLHVKHYPVFSFKYITYIYNGRIVKIKHFCCYILTEPNLDMAMTSQNNFLSFNITLKNLWLHNGKILIFICKTFFNILLTKIFCFFFRQWTFYSVLYLPKERTKNRNLHLAISSSIIPTVKLFFSSIKKSLILLFFLNSFFAVEEFFEK